MIAIRLATFCATAAFVAAILGMLSPALAGVLSVLAALGAAVYLGVEAMRRGHTLRLDVEAGDKRASMAIGTAGSEKKRGRVRRVSSDE